MTGPAVNALDFATVDDLAFAAERGRLSKEALPLLEARDLGPVLEFAQLASSGILPPLGDSSFLALNEFGQIVRILNGRQRQWLNPSRNAGLFKMRQPMIDEIDWTAFGLAAQRAATAAGFPNAIAAQLVAALGELRSNIYEHAEAPDTGLIAFYADVGHFEFVASDRGIGVLESLRNAIAYRTLTDHGEALRLALSDGVSRFGSDTGRGHGFRPLFVGLANLNGVLRFRSGDHALMIDGGNPTLMMAKSAQKPWIPGFFASVSCSLVQNLPPQFGAKTSG